MISKGSVFLTAEHMEPFVFIQPVGPPPFENEKL